MCREELNIRKNMGRDEEVQSLSLVFLVNLVPQEFHFMTLSTANSLLMLLFPHVGWFQDVASAVLQPAGSTGW